MFISLFLSFQINLVIFVLALRSALSSSTVNTARTLSSTKDSTGTTKATAGTTLRKAKLGLLKGSATLLPLLGLTWVFGLLVFNRDTTVFKYLFAIFNSLQGTVIFVFHVLMHEKVSLVLGNISYAWSQVVQIQTKAAEYTLLTTTFKIFFSGSSDTN
jgi:hypothetical protein